MRPRFLRVTRIRALWPSQGKSGNEFLGGMNAVSRRTYHPSILLALCYCPENINTLTDRLPHKKAYSHPPRLYLFKGVSFRDQATIPSPTSSTQLRHTTQSILSLSYQSRRSRSEPGNIWLSPKCKQREQANANSNLAISTSSAMRHEDRETLRLAQILRNVHHHV